MGFAFLFFPFYIGYHSLYGSRGYFSLVEKKIECEELEKKYKNLCREKNTLEKKIELLQENIDSDLIEQYAWKLFRILDSKARVMLR